MKSIQIILNLILVLLLVFSTGCSKQEKDLTNKLIDNKTQQANVMRVKDYYKSIEDIKIVQSPYGVFKYDDRTELPLLMEGSIKEFKKISVKGITMEISGIPAEISEKNIEIKQGEETKDWLISSHFDSDKKIMKVVMISVNPMKQFGEIAKLIVKNNNTEKNIDLSNKTLVINTELADGTRIYKIPNIEIAIK